MNYISSDEEDQDKFLSQKSTNSVFSINWIDLEILRLLLQSKQPMYKSEIIQLLRLNNFSLSNKPDSSFYAIFDRLSSEDLININKIEGKGYRAYLEITPKGIIQIKNAINWSLNTLFEQISLYIVERINIECKKMMGCTKDHIFGICTVCGPKFLVPEVCSKCVNATEKEKFYRYNLLMPYSYDSNVENYQNIRVTHDDIPLKNNHFDRFMSALNLAVLDKKQQNEFLEEIYRIMKKDSKVVFVELLHFESYIFDAIEELTEGLTMLLAKKRKNKLNRFSKEELKKTIETVFGKGHVEVHQLREFLYAVATK